MVISLQELVDQKEIENQEEHLRDILMLDICEINVLHSNIFLFLIRLLKIMKHWLFLRDLFQVRIIHFWHLQ